MIENTLLECFLSNSTRYFIKWIYIAGKAEGVGTQINWGLSFYINKLITKCQSLECFLSNSTQYFKWIYIAGKAEGVGTQRRISTFCFFEDMLLFYLQIMLTWSCLYKGHSIKPILVSQKSSWG